MDYTFSSTILTEALVSTLKDTYWRKPFHPSTNYDLYIPKTWSHIVMEFILNGSD